MTNFPTNADITTVPSNHGLIRAALGALRDATVGLLGTDGTVATALATLGALGGGYVAKTAAYSVVAGDRGKIIDATSGSWTLSLPAVSGLSGFSFVLRNSGAGAITLDPNASEQIDGATTLACTPGCAVLVICTGTAWVTHWMISPAGTATLTNKSIAVGQLTGVLAAANGGTGQASLPLGLGALQGYATTATAAGTTTLTNASVFNQIFTGTTTQFVALPGAATVVVGYGYLIANQSTGALTVNANSGGNLTTILPGQVALILCNTASGGGPASWTVIPIVRTISPCTVASLPSAATAGQGTRGLVTDATAATFAAAPTGGGSLKVPVYSDGTNWLMG